MRIRPTTTRLIIVHSKYWANRADAYLQRKFYHSHTNIYSVPATWNQWLFLHWYNLILSHQGIWKPLTLQWFPIEDTDTLHKFESFKLEKMGCPKHMVTYGYQFRCLHWRIWHIIHIDILSEYTEALSGLYACLLFFSLLLFSLWLYQLLLYWHLVSYRL